MPCARPSRGWPRPVRRSRLPSSRATSRCTTSTRARRSTRRLSSARSVCWNEPTLAVPSFPSDATARRSCSWVRRSRRTTAASGRRSRTARRRVASPILALPELTGLFAALGEAASEQLLASAHDASDGGLVVARSSSAWALGSGCELDATSACRSRRHHAVRRGLRQRARDLCGGCGGSAWTRSAGVTECRSSSSAGSAASRIVVRAGCVTPSTSRSSDARAAYEDALPLAMEPR